MAKLKGPLFSLGARGQLGKTLVFFPWKGVDSVREYVVPANPQTAAQLAQRALMTAAVLEFHGALYSAADIGALNRWANTLAATMSGFNAMVKDHIEEALLGNTWERIRQVTVPAVVALSFQVNVVKESAGNAPTVRWGTSRTNMPNNAVMADLGGDVWDHSIIGLAASTLYYFTIDVGASATDWGRVGIYAQRTTA